MQTHSRVNKMLGESFAGDGKRDVRIKQKTVISYKVELAPEVASAVS